MKSNAHKRNECLINSGECHNFFRSIFSAIIVIGILIFVWRVWRFIHAFVFMFIQGNVYKMKLNYKVIYMFVDVWQYI